MQVRSVIIKIVFCLILCGSVSTVLGAFDLPTLDARVLAAGNVRSTLSSIANPALLRPGRPLKFGVSGTSYVANLNIWGSALTMQGDLGQYPVNFAATFYGDEVYQEYTLLAGSGYQIFPLLTLGLSLQLRGMSMQNYDAHMGGGMTVGARVVLMPDLILGILWQNMLQKPMVETAPEPEIFSIGLKYSAPVLELTLGLEKDAQLPLNTQMGVLSNWSDWWGLAVGYESAMAAFTVGPHLNWASWSLRYAWQWRAYLPPRQSFSLQYTF